jgi:hypothetical protein
VPDNRIDLILRLVRAVLGERHSSARHVRELEIRSAQSFKKMLTGTANQFPRRDCADKEKQSHVAFHVQGYNEAWKDAAKLYERVCASLFSGAEGLGICVAFDRPSRAPRVDKEGQLLVLE